MGATLQRVFSWNGWAARRQGLAESSGSCKYRSRAVALMDVAINRHCRANFVITLHAPNCHRHVVNHAESFAMVWKCVVKSSADVDRHPVFQRLLGGKYGTAGREPKRFHQF